MKIYTKYETLKSHNLETRIEGKKYLKFEWGGNLNICADFLAHVYVKHIISSKNIYLQIHQVLKFRFQKLFNASNQISILRQHWVTRKQRTKITLISLKINQL